MKTRLSLRRRGFTLIEVLMVLVILVILAAMAVTAYGPILQRAKANAAKAQIGLLKTPLESFQLNHGGYPPSLEWLWIQPGDMTVEQWGGPYCDPLTLDPWGRPYQYVTPGNHNPASFDLWSAGPNGQSGDGDDIGNWAWE